jgi:hypothetical protein
MGKSLTEVAKKILSEGAYPSVTPDMLGKFDRDAHSMTTAKSSLKPNAGYNEKQFSNPGSMAPTAPDNSVEDLGAALVNNTDTPPSAKAAGKMGKDTSGSSQSRKGALAAEKSKNQAEVMEEDVELDEEQIDEDIEISEELREFIEQKMSEGLTEEEIAVAIDENFEIVESKYEDEDEEEKDEKHMKEMKNYKVDMSEHVEALFAGEELSEDFKMKAIAIFEAAVKQKVQEELASIEEAYAETLEEQIEQIQNSLTEDVDNYLNYVVEQWVSENEVAIEAGLRTELTEEFISGLRNLFAEHYIDIPEDKVSVVEEMAEKVAELEVKLNEEIDRNVNLTTALNESAQNEIVFNACVGLTEVQAEKLKSLAEGLDYSSIDEYENKINILRESYFNSSVRTENVLDSNNVDSSGNMLNESLSGPMAAYVRTLGKTLPR